MTIANDAQQLIALGIDCQYSDLFFKPATSGWQLFGRSTAATRLIDQLSVAHAQGLINYFKFNAQMDLSEHRRPQIGAWHYQTDHGTVDLRLASVGDYLNHETLVIRLLVRQVTDGDFLFINPQRYHELQALLPQRGLFLFAGPTGSGKTTLMYHLAQELSQQQLVMTIEDPTEIVVDQFTQLQVNDAAKMSYAELLKISLRLRPDILIIGEIRDTETAEMAVQAALSGHLVLATIHARTSGGVIQRMLGLGVSKSALLNALTSCCYQRLLLTSMNQVKVILDVLLPNQLVELIEHPTSFLSHWQTDLKEAQRHGEITEHTFDQYQFG